jgi:putative flippase GtrA
MRFAAVGAVGTAAQYLVLWFGVTAVALSATVASGAGFVLGAVVNYLLNYHYTFASDRPHAAAAARFFTVAGAGLLINTALMHALVVWVTWHYMLAQVLATAVVLLWNFLVNRHWTFGVSAPVRGLEGGGRDE